MTGDSHRVLREQLGAYALGQLAGDRWREVHAHLELCAACRADLEEIAPVAGLLGAARDRVRLDDDAGPGSPPPLSVALIEEVRAAGPPSADPVATVATLDARRTRRRWLPLAAAAAVALLAGGVGFFAGGAAAPAPVPTEAIAVRVVDPDIQAQAALVDHTWGMEVKMTATGFDPGATYLVTVTDDAGRVVGAGEFIGTGAAQMRCNLNSSILRADASLVQVTASDGEVVLDATV